MSEELVPTAASASSRRKEINWLQLSLLVIVVSIPYVNSFEVPFIFDDLRNIANNPEIRHLWPRPAESNFTHYRRPVGRHTFALNYWWGRQEVWGYHAANLAIHLVAACLLLMLVKEALSDERNASSWRMAAGPLALAAAMIWAIHPLQTQSVTYIVQRFESLSALFLLGTLWLLVRGTRASVAWPWYFGSLVAYSLGIATKETAGAIPLVALLFDRSFLSRSWSEVVSRRWGYYLGFLPAIIWFLTRFEAPQGDLATLSKGIGWWEYFRSQPGVILHYLRLAVWPDQLCLDYNWPIATNWWTIAACGVPLIVLLGASCWALFRWPRIGFLGMTFFLTLAPSSSIVPIADLAYEHRMYLPLAPLIILTVLVLYQVCIWLCRTEFQSVRAVMAITCILALLLGARTWQRNCDWASPRKLWESNVAIAPQSYRAQANLAMILLEAGETERAISHLQKSIAIKPTAVAYRNLGLIHRDRRELDQAEKCFLRALQDRPSYAPASLDLARMFSESQKWPQAVSRFQATLALEPKSPIDIIDRAAVLDELGSALARSGDLPAAVRVFRQAVTAEPRFAVGYLHLAMASLDQGDLSTADEAARTLLRLKPDSKAARELLDKIEARTAQR